jgi:hypothetical protein
MKSYREQFAVIAVLWTCLGGLVYGIVPCDVQSSQMARAQEPTPAPDVPLTPTVEAPTLSLKERYDVGEPITARLQLRAGEKLIDVEWELPLQYIEPPDSLDTIHPYPIGVGTWPVRANYIVDIGGKLSIRKIIEPLTVGDPEPPEPPKPLIEIAGPKALEMAFVYGKLSAGSFTSLAHFRGVELSALADMGLADNPAVPVIRARLEKIAPFDGAKLTVELSKIAGELGKAPEPPTPPTPPVVEGKRYVVILSETEDNTPAMGLLVNALRKGETAAYLTSKGHTLDVLDDDNPTPIVAKLLPLGVQQPALFVLDAGTNAVLHSQPLPATAAEVLAAIKAHGG